MPVLAIAADALLACGRNQPLDKRDRAFVEQMILFEDDEVIVLTGRDKGKSGNILRVMPKEQRVLVQGGYSARDVNATVDRLWNELEMFG